MTVDEITAEFDDLRIRITKLEKALLEICERLQDYPVVKSVTIYGLNDEGYYLREPVNILVESYEDEVVASFSEVEAFGAGSTESEAIARLKQEIVTLYEDLQGAHPKELGKLPRAWKGVLSRLIAKNVNA